MYIVMERTFEYNDEYYCTGEAEGGIPVEVAADRSLAERVWILKGMAKIRDLANGRNWRGGLDDYSEYGDRTWDEELLGRVQRDEHTARDVYTLFAQHPHLFYYIGELEDQKWSAPREWTNKFTLTEGTEQWLEEHLSLLERLTPG